MDAKQSSARALFMRSAASFESSDSMQIFERPTNRKPPSGKRSHASRQEPVVVPANKRMRDSPSDYSSCGSEGASPLPFGSTWGSPGDSESQPGNDMSIDLNSSDILDEFEDLECNEAAPEDRSHESGGSSQSIGGNYQADNEILFLQRRHCLEEVAARNDAPTKMTNSPTKSGDFRPAHVPRDCLVARTAALYGFSPFVVSVGTTYFQRICSRDSALRKAALACPDFAPFVEGIPYSPRVHKSVGAPLHCCQTARHWLMAVHLTCIYLAAKNVEVVPYYHLLRTMLERLHNLKVTKSQAEALELECLMALDWRLGPFFLHED